MVNGGEPMVDGEERLVTLYTLMYEECEKDFEKILVLVV